MIEVWGVDLVTFSLRMVHGLMAAGWLLFDFLVFWLHFDVKNPDAPLERRHERARVMHGIDQMVALIFLLMLPTGIALCYLTDTPIFTTDWLNLKHLLYAIIIIDALYLLPISGTAIRNLQAMIDGAENVDELNHQIKHSMDRAMPAVWLVWTLVAVISVISMLNLKSPEGQELIFRKTAADATEVGSVGESGDEAATTTDHPLDIDRPLDITDPRAPASEAQTFQLHTTTLITRDLAEARGFYGEGLGLAFEGPIALDAETRNVQRELWGIPEPVGWDLYLLRRTGVEGTIQVRLLLLDQETPRVHSTWDAREPGPFSMGFPAEELTDWDAALRQAGHQSMNPMSTYQVPRSDGTEYGIQETIWKAPDFMHAVTIARLDGVPPLGPYDSDTGRGGPVYSAQSIEDSDTVLAFYTDVLGLELRSDREWKSHGSEGALAVPDGTVFRFAIAYAKGARYGHLLFIDFRDDALPATGVAPRPPNRGLVMWTFPVRDLDDTARRVREAGVDIVHDPVRYTSPSLDDHRAMTVLAPNGFLIELFER